MKNNKKLGIISLILSIISLVIPNFILLESLDAEIIFVVVFIIAAVVSIVLGVMGKKDAKGQSIAGIIIGIFTVILLCITLMGLMLYKSVTNCVDNGNEMSTCELMDQEVEVPTIYVTEEQMKKGE